jgi:crotonobetainyl-CoA:carnitine CoA-transferase CaiB-like acyl-CoA transferase
VLSTRPRDEWLKVFAKAKVPAGPVNRIDQVSRDPELIARGLVYTAREGERRVPQVGIGIGVDGASASYRLPPPRLGEHNRDVLRSWLDYDDAVIGELTAAKIF